MDAIQGKRPVARAAAAIDRPPPAKKPAVTDQEKAELFCKTYAGVSRIPHDKKKDHDIKVEARRVLHEKCKHCDGKKTGTCSPFTLTELKAAIRKLKKNMAPGADGVANDMIRQLSENGATALLTVANKSWMEAVIPAE